MKEDMIFDKRFPNFEKIDFFCATANKQLFSYRNNIKPVVPVDVIKNYLMRHCIEIEKVKVVLEELKHWLFKEEKSFTIVIKKASENGVVNHACGYKYAILNTLKQIEQVEEKLFKEARNDS